ncbi:MAG: T9SS type A sorting domain-containing protein, partial [Bacteroidales bacterium]|nr:T9SS type A sorting domain-containing protein [Bacteroidales bacterium]
YIVPYGFSQEVIATAGNTNTSGSKSIDWTLGEVIIETLADNDAMLTQGFHQPVLIISAVQELEMPDMEITVFPNPVSDRVTIKTENMIQDKFSYTLTDMNGKILKQEKMHSQEVEIPFVDYAPSVYYLIIHNGEQKINTYKIIKTLK